jgi:hypothetical protein
MTAPALIGLLDAVQTISQVVIVAAGMDARAYRMPWPDGTVVDELDQPEVMSAKAGLLAGMPRRPACGDGCCWRTARLLRSRDEVIAPLRRSAPTEFVLE